MLIRHRKGPRTGPQTDEGVAIVVALMVTVLAFLIMTAILAQSIHNIVQTGYARRRIAAVNAAEAGLNWYGNRLVRTSLTVLSTANFGWSKQGNWYVRQPQLAASEPEDATFEVRVLYSAISPCDKVGDPSSCDVNKMVPIDLATYNRQGADAFPNPVYAVVRSIGTAGTAHRALEEFVRLRAKVTVVTGGLSAISLCMGSAAKVSVQGDLAINNQQVSGSRPAAYSKNCKGTYDNGDIVLDGGKYLRTLPNANAGAHGDLLIRGGGLTVDGTRHIEIAGDIWVEESIKLGCNGGATCVKPSSTCVKTGTIQCVAGDAFARDIFQGPYGHIQGEQVLCQPACPPDAFFTEIHWVASEWDGWIIREMSSTSQLKSYAEAAVKPTVLHVSACPAGGKISIPTPTLTLQTSVAIVSECAYEFAPPGTTLLKNPAAANGCATCALLVLSVIPAGKTIDDMTFAVCGNNEAPLGPRDISISGNQNFTDTGLFLYTPCFLWIEGNQCQGCSDDDPTPDEIDKNNGKSHSENEVPIQGQFIARYLILKTGVKLIQNDIGKYLTYLPGQVSSFSQDVKFIREIPVADALVMSP